ncbi:hypothetical protein ACJZ2D_011693 [Fusarium nematophilum]
MFIKPDLEQRAPLPRHEILHEARGQIEAFHRRDIYYSSTKLPLNPCPFPPGTCSRLSHDDMRDLSPHHAEDCCNKTVPIYIITSHGRSHLVLRYALHNWLYHKWFQPYRSDIEYRQFIAKLFYPCQPSVDTPSALLVKLINELNARICDRVTSVQKEVVTLPTESELCGGPCFRDQRFYILQPLFRALTIILLEDDFNVRITDMGKIPVLLTLTGEEHGLSQRLSFESISHQVEDFVSETAVRVPLHIAIEFVLAQQEREIAAFGPQPDPVESTRGLQNGLHLHAEGLRHAVRQLGGGDEPVVGPSSTWVDTRVYTEWTGNGAWEDKRIYVWEEKRERWRMLCQVAGVDDNWAIRRNYTRRKSI